jgi:hypothetical protein
MSNARFTALVAALALGTAAPRLHAQDTSAAGQARPDTSGYRAGGGVDTSAAPADSAADTARVGQEAPLKPRQPVPRLRDSSPPPPHPTDAPGHVDAGDTTGPLGATDTSAMCGRHPDTTKVGDSTGAKPVPCPSGASGDSAR